MFFECSVMPSEPDRVYWDSSVFLSFINGEVLTFMDVTLAVARRARDLQRDGLFSDRLLKPMDALHIATATLLDPLPKAIHTYDTEWLRWSDSIDILISEPSTESPRMPLGEA